MNGASQDATLALSTGSGGELVVALAGDWLLENEPPSIDGILTALSQTPQPDAIRFHTAQLGAGNSGLLTRLLAIRREAAARGVRFDTDALPDGARRLIDLALAVKPREGAKRSQRRVPFLARVGERTQLVWR